MGYILKRNYYDLGVRELKLTNWKVLSMTAFMAVTLAACNTDEAKEQPSNDSANSATAIAEQNVQNENEHNDEGESHEQNMTRFIVSSTEKVFVMDDKLNEIKHFDIGEGAFTLADSGRYAFVRDVTEKDSYTIIDSGIFVEDHSDHMHPYEEEPAIAKVEIAANKPAHMISHAGFTAVFNDGSGKVDVFDNANLSTDVLEPSFVYEGIAHHGAAVPLSTGELAVTFVKAEGESLPIGVKIVDATGKEQAIITDRCEGLHGTAYGGEGSNEKLAFGCMGKVVIYDVATKTTTDVTLADEGARVGTVKHIGGSDYFFTNYSVENAAQTKIGVINSKSAELKLVELPAAYKSATLVTADDIAYVLAEDGNIYAIDLTTASIKQTISALNPFKLDEEAPVLFTANNHVYLIMPSYQKIYEVHGNHAHEVIKFDFEPTAILAIEAK